MAVELFREMIRRTVQRSGDGRGAVAARLPARLQAARCSTPSYFETFNRDNVSLVDLRHETIEEVTPTGIRTTQRLRRARRARARDRLRRDDRRARPASTCAAAAADCSATTGPTARAPTSASAWSGYPNLFVCVGPGSPGVLATYPPQIELQVGWIADFIGHLEDHGFTRAEAERRRAGRLVRPRERGRARARCSPPPSCNSWYNGQNIEGKPRVFLPYVGGLPAYMDRCNEVAARTTRASHSLTQPGEGPATYGRAFVMIRRR